MTAQFDANPIATTYDAKASAYAETRKRISAASEKTVGAAQSARHNGHRVAKEHQALSFRFTQKRGASLQKHGVQHFSHRRFG